MSKRSEYGELLSARFRLALIADALGLPSLDDADTENCKYHFLYSFISISFELELG